MKETVPVQQCKDVRRVARRTVRVNRVTKLSSRSRRIVGMQKYIQDRTSDGCVARRVSSGKGLSEIIRSSDG